MKKIKSIIGGIVGIFFVICFIAIQLLGLTNIISLIASARLEILLFVVLIIFIIVAYNSNQKKKQSQEKTISVINKERKETENEINRIETKWDSIEQRLEEISQEKNSLISAIVDYDLDIERIKKEKFTAENKAEIKRLSKLRKSASEERERSEYEENRLRNEINLLSKSLGGYKSALRSIKEISKTIEGYSNYD